MKHIGNEIHRIMEEKGLVKRQVAIKLGMSASRLGQLRAHESIDSCLLERICKVIEVSPGYFFDDWPNDCYTFGESQSVNASSNVVTAGNEVEALRELLKEKDLRIAEKERVINLLMERAGVSDDVRP